MMHDLENAIIINGVVYELTPVKEGHEDCSECDFEGDICPGMTNVCVLLFGAEQAVHCNIKQISF